MRRAQVGWRAALLAAPVVLSSVAPAPCGAVEALAIDPPFVPKNTAPASAVHVIRGIGFSASTTVAFDGTTAAVTFVDRRTLQVQVPTSATGKVARIAVTDGAESDDIYPFFYTDVNVYVKPTGSDSANGTSPATAKRTIGGALGEVTTATTFLIRVAAGTYNERDLVVFDKVVLSGGWNDTFTVRDPDQHVTVVDGGRAGFVLRSGGLLGSQILDGLTIRNGLRDGLGGGAYIISGENSVVSNSVLVGNTTSVRGGAIYATFSTVFGGEPILSRNVMLGNRSYSKGGGAVSIYPFYTQGKLIDVAVSDNHIVGNRSFKSRGGGLELTGHAAYGYNNVSLQAVGNVVAGNKAAAGAGISIVATSSSDTYDLTLDNNLLFGNAAPGEGGGFLVGGVGHVIGTLTGTTASENIAGMDGGGGLRFSPGVTFDGFSAENLIAWGNLNGNLAGSPLANYSLIGGGSAGTGNLATDPGFRAGPMGRFYLVQDAGSTSPAVDAGNGTAVDLSMEARTTSAMLDPDAGLVDMGFHYPAGVGPSADPIAFTRIDPDGGDLGGADWVLIRGRGFDPGVAVTFDGAPAADLLYVSDRRLLARPAPHAPGLVDVAVTNTDLTSVTAPGAYRYLDNLPPEWTTTVGLQTARSARDCVRSALLTWNPAVDGVSEPVRYTIHREICTPETINPSIPCTNFGYFPSAANRLASTPDPFFLDTAFGVGGQDQKYLYLVRAADAATPIVNPEFNYSKRLVLVTKLATDTVQPSPVGETLDLPAGTMLDWSGAPGAVSYRVYRQATAPVYATPGSLTPFITLTTANNDADADGVTDSRFTDAASPAPDQFFFYKIAAVDPCGVAAAPDLAP